MPDLSLPHGFRENPSTPSGLPACAGRPTLDDLRDLDLAAVIEEALATPPAFMARRRHDLLSRTIVEEVVPRLLLSRRDGAGEATASAPAAESPDLQADVDHLVELLLRPGFDVDGPEMQRLSGRRPGAESVYLDLLTPAARRLGVMWEEDLCDFVKVTVGLMRLQQILTTLSVPLGQEGGRQRRPRILLAPAPGEQHSFGLSMVATFFQRAGWSGWSGVPASNEDLIARVKTESFAIVGFSVSDERHLEGLTRTIRTIRRVSRNREIGIMAGGPLFVAHPELVALVSADATAADGRQAVSQAHRLLTLIPSRG